MAYLHGTVAMGKSPRPICVPGKGGVVLRVKGDGEVYLGGEHVTLSGESQGICISSADGAVVFPGGTGLGMRMSLPDEVNTLYGVAADGATPSVSYLLPQG